MLPPHPRTHITIPVYLQYWDDFVDQWYLNPIPFFNSNIHPWNQIHSHLLQQANALPEPYCGDPYNCSAVIMNYNPGSMTPTLQQHPNGSFILTFKPNFAYKYFAKNFPYLTNPLINGTNSTGGGFWKIRDGWIKRLILIKYNIHSNKNPFAIDICP